MGQKSDFLINIGNMISLKKRYSELLVLVTALLLSSGAHALDTGISNVMVNGFGTIGLIKSSDKDLGFREEVSQQGIFDEYNLSHNSDLGLQVNYYATDKLDFGIQLLAKDRHKNSLDKSIQSAYINYSLTPKFDLRLGRLGVDSYLMSDYRHVGFTHLWTHLPTEFYAAHPVTAIDGMDIVFKQPLSEGLFRAKLWFGQAKYDFYSADTSTINLNQLLGSSLSWEDESWNFRLTYSQSKSKIDNDTIKPLEVALQAASSAGWPEATNFTNLTINDKTLRYYAAAVSYDDAHWLIQSELGLVNTGSTLVPGSLSGYLSVGRKLGTVTPFIVGSWVRSKHDRLIMPTPSLSAYNSLQQISQYVFNQFYMTQHTVSVGARWDIQPKVALKAQWDKTWVDQYSGFLLDRPAGAIAEKRQLDTFSITVDFLF